MQNDQFASGSVIVRKSMAFICLYIVVQPSIGWCDDSVANLLSASGKQRQSLNCMQGKYQIIKKVGEKAPKTIGGTFVIEDNKSRYECTKGERPFTYTFDGQITSSLRTKDDTGCLMGNMRIHARANAPGIGKPDTNPRTFMLTAFDEPLENFEFYDDEKDMHFSSSATEKTELFKILITGKEGNFIRAETVNIDPALLASQTPSLEASTRRTGYSEIPSAFEKIKFTFDITKNYCLVSKEIYAPSGRIQEKTIAKNFVLIDNVWIPVRLERMHYHPNGNIRMTEDISYSDIKLPKDIDDRRFQIDFPPEATVVNEVK